jgi:hypothetical protein
MSTTKKVLIAVAILVALFVVLFVLLGAVDDEPVEDNSGVSFPMAAWNEAGLAYAPVATEADGRNLCDAAQSGWPDEYAEIDQVTFDVPDDVPGSGSDVTCVRRP